MRYSQVHYYLTFLIHEFWYQDYWLFNIGPSLTIFHFLFYRYYVLSLGEYEERQKNGHFFTPRALPMDFANFRDTLNINRQNIQDHEEKNKQTNNGGWLDVFINSTQPYLMAQRKHTYIFTCPLRSLLKSAATCHTSGSVGTTNKIFPEAPAATVTYLRRQRPTHSSQFEATYAV